MLVESRWRVPTQGGCHWAGVLALSTLTLIACGGEGFSTDASNDGTATGGTDAIGSGGSSGGGGGGGSANGGDIANGGSDSQPDGLTCRDDCECQTFAGTEYMLCTQQLTVYDALAECNQAGGGLIKVTSAELEDWATEQMMGLGAFAYSTAGTDALQEGMWHWGNDPDAFFDQAMNRPLGGAYINWSPGQPNNNFEEDCLQVNELGWNDISCTMGQAGFICQ